MDSCISRRSRRIRAVAAASILALAIAPAAASAENNAGSMASGMGIGVAAAVTSLLYGPIKIGYALGGVVVGGLGWIFSGGDSDVAKTVMTPAVYGDYVVSPAVLQGQESLEFYGRAPGYTPDDYAPSDVSAAPPTDW